MADDEAKSCPVERKNVVADVAEMLMSREIFIGEADELELLGAVDRLVSFAGRETLARFHLHESKDVSAPDDEIDLAAAESFVARDNRISAQAIKPRGAALSAPAERSRIHRHQAYLLRREQSTGGGSDVRYPNA